jgi:hypothetical protein
MAGWRNVIPPLGIYQPPIVEVGGFLTPIPILRIGGEAGTVQAGFISLLPVIPLGSDGVIAEQTDNRRRRTYFTMIGRTRLGR